MHQRERERGPAVLLTLSSFGTSIVAVTVGPRPDPSRDPAPSTFKVHEGFLCRSSPFFERRLTRQPDRTAAEKKVELLTVKPADFALYMQWLYRRRVSVAQGQPALYGPLIDAYLLGELVEDVDFKDAVMDRITDSINAEAGKGADESSKVLPYMHTRRVYQGTVRGSALRRLLVDVHLAEGRACWYRSADGDGPAPWHDLESLSDIAAALNGCRAPGLGRRDAPPYRTQPCAYHDHVGKNRECYRTRLFR